MEKACVAKRGRPAEPITNTNRIVQAVVGFLKTLMGEALAKRVVVALLLAFEIPHDYIVEATGLSDRSIWSIKKSIRSGKFDALFVLGHGGGRVGKATEFESEIAEELGKNNYHTRQQVADMILEKFGVRMSVSAVGKLLKKTASRGLNAAQFPQKLTQ